MKLISWNVNGLRACLQKGFLDFFNAQDADFFCLQETKLQEGQVTLELPGYEQYWCYAEKKGYSGTAIFTKHTPLTVRYGLGISELDTEGRLITLEYEEFYLITCYTPNAQRGLARLSHRMKWDNAFRSYISGLDQHKPVIICGDLNVAHKEIDLKNPGSNRGNAGFSDEERESFTSTLAAGFTDTFRHLNPDATGAYTWWSYMFNARQNNAGWRIDYFLVSDRICGQIVQAPIYSDILGSDHCPVGLTLDTLCNGGVWSPEGGEATLVQQKEKERSPAAKIAAGGALCALILAGTLLSNPSAPDLPLQETTTPTKVQLALPEPTLSPDLFLSSTPQFVTTTTFPNGLYELTLSTQSGFLIEYPCLSDGATIWVVEEEDPEFTEQLQYLNSNFFLKLELTAMGQRYCNTESNPEVTYWGPETDGIFLVTARKFYVEGTCMGWFIYGYIPGEMMLDIRIPMTASDVAFSVTHHATPIKYHFEFTEEA